METFYCDENNGTKGSSNSTKIPQQFLRRMLFAKARLCSIRFFVCNVMWNSIIRISMRKCKVLFSLFDIHFSVLDIHFSLFEIILSVIVIHFSLSYVMFTGKHRGVEHVDVVSRRCVVPGCGKHPAYGNATDRWVLLPHKLWACRYCVHEVCHSRSRKASCAWKCDRLVSVPFMQAYDRQMRFCWCTCTSFRPKQRHLKLGLRFHEARGARSCQASCIHSYDALWRSSWVSLCAYECVFAFTCALYADERTSNISLTCCPKDESVEVVACLYDLQNIQSVSSPSYAERKNPSHVNILSKPCLRPEHSKRSDFLRSPEFCVEHKKPSHVNVFGKLCKHPEGCGLRASFGDRNSTVLMFCFAHKNESRESAASSCRNARTDTILCWCSAWHMRMSRSLQLRPHLQQQSAVRMIHHHEHIMNTSWTHHAHTSYAHLLWA